MALIKEPESMNELVYFTRRVLKAGDKTGSAVAWASKQKCTKCGKALMGKPVEKGKVKIRANEYVCPSCNYTVEKEEYEDTLTASVNYTCPHCAFKNGIQVPFKRKKVQIFDEAEMKKKTAEVIRFQCEKCKQNIDITKKMK